MLLYKNLPRFLCQQSATGCTACLDFCATKAAKFSLEIYARKVYGCLGKHTQRCMDFALKSCQIFLALCANATIRTCWKDASVCVPKCYFFLLTAQKSPLLSFSLSPNLLMKEWMTFSSFNLTLSHFSGIPKSNRWNRLRSRAEIKCSFKSHFLFFNSPHFNKDPLSLLFPKSLFPF